ncbi:Pls/PosA family non-ribosomal peptide synthetase [Pseudonocardia aurantiaca]|uniref:Pls/PosA family non-ribosomal peptide synthetase n=1 Tax=Pseudonocardia aurantiaca TaxID=75290 RepID=A0ABW4FMC4_9PSEU
MTALTQGTCGQVTKNVPGPPVELQARREQRRQDGVTLAAQPDARLVTPNSELVLMDQHEAQGWRVRHKGERLDHLFEVRCDWVRTYGRADKHAIDSPDGSLTYDELDARANQLARYLRLRGAGAGDRIGLLLDRPTDSYAAILAVLKIGAAYVPLDVDVTAGEIGIAGIGLACGYLNRDDLTEKAYIPDFLGIPANPSGRIFRAGDLGRVNPDGEIEYVSQIDGGRIDGDRIDGNGAARRYWTEIDEIESDLLRASQASAPPAIELPVPEAVDLLVPQAVEPPVPQAIDLPVPQAIDLPELQVIDLPVPRAEKPLPAVDRVKPPASPAGAAATTDTERELSALLSEVVGVDRVEVDANFFDELGADSMVLARFCARLRRREDLPSISMKDVYQHPTIRGLATAFAPAPVAAPPPARSETERALTEVLAEVLGSDQVTADSHFFDELGADSMVMTRFCARLRKREDLPSISIKDVYQHPTIRGLAIAFTDQAPTAPVGSSAPASTSSPVPPKPEARRPASTREYLFCGALQFLLFLGYAFVYARIFESAFLWITAGETLLDKYLRAVATGGAIFLLQCTLPILAKWVLIGRWKPQEIRVWSLAYVRFWFVKTLIQANPLVRLFIGSPLYVLYLRALGAKIGRGVVIFSKHMPVCTDLLTIGDGTVIRKDTFLTCYRAHAGLIQTGTVTLGKDVFVGEATVIDIETSMGDGAQIGHSSSLHRGQSVPDGERWHGSPGQRSETNYRPAGAADCGSARRAVYSALQLLKVLVLYVPLAFGVASLFFSEISWLGALLGSEPLTWTSWSFYGQALIASVVFFFGALLLTVLVSFTVPRVLNLAIEPDKVYPLYGFHYALHRTIARMTNAKFLTTLFGDSSYIAHYLRFLGYKLSPLVQAGSNFGKETRHETPYLVSVGTGTVCADGISFVNADFSSTSFSVSRASIGANSFTGNVITYPSQGKIGDNCLLGTKVLVPIDGEVRENVGLLGSPSFEIPRTVARDSRFHHLASGDELRRGLAGKNRHNTVTIALHLLAQWFLSFVLILGALCATDLYASRGTSALALWAVLSLVISVFYQVLVERAARGFRALRPTYCSIYQLDFWRVERFLKNSSDAHMVLNGTPFKNLAWRMLGVRLGKRLFDDGCSMAEKNMVTIGDDVTLNAGSAIQCHSQEDYAYKSDYITVGSGCTVGTAALVHYGVTMGDGAVLAPDSFLMKGEEVPPNAHWGGNPAHEMRDPMLVVEAPALNAAAPVLVEQPRSAAPVEGTSVAAGGLVPPSAELAPSPEPLTAAAPVPPPDPAEMRWFGYGDLPVLDAGLQQGR